MLKGEEFIYVPAKEKKGTYFDCELYVPLSQGTHCRGSGQASSLFFPDGQEAQFSILLILKPERKLQVTIKSF